MTEIDAAAPLGGWCVSSSNRLPVASYHVAHLSDALPKIRRGTEAGSPSRGADETLEPNLRWWEKAAEEKSSVMEARIMCLGSGRNRCWSQANGSVPALSKTRLLDVWRFTVCNLWMGVNLECILYLVQHQGETDCPSHF